jgi:sulfonate transport system ATP-binding protein
MMMLNAEWWVPHLRDSDSPSRSTPQSQQPGKGMSIDIRQLQRRFGERSVLDGLDLQIRPGEFVAIVGRSGCGKSTLLRILAGLDQPSSGLLHVDHSPPQAHRDDVRLMFQEARLLPWKTVASNVELGLPLADAPSRARGALAEVGLADRAHDWPAVLSGGQRQRVALARALAHTPRLLLLDEPLGALDALTRLEMHRLIESLWLERGFTAVLVTHDVSEAVALADRVLLIEDGRIRLDEPVAVPRPRRRADPRVAELEELILSHVLKQPARLRETGPGSQRSLSTSN